ncbi:MAG: PAS domain S-box protein [Betaproteobacteria bacterium]|jgi:diguanylate cyclase (GGDEF)-like protein/PAS domain S-box-containing protein
MAQDRPHRARHPAAQPRPSAVAKPVRLGSFHALVELAPDAVFIVSGEQVAFVNEAGIRFMGAAGAAQLLGRVWVDLIHTDDRARFVHRVQNPGTGALRMDLRYLRLDGDEVSGELVGAPVRWSERQALMLSIRDSTQNREAMACLERMRVAMDTAPDPMFLVDRDTLRYVDVNEAACQSLGYTREELLALEPALITEGFDRAAMGAVYAALPVGRRVAETREQSLRRLRRKDGSLLNVEIRRSVVRVGGRDLVVAVARDIAEQLRTEVAQARFRLAMDVAAEAVYLVDPTTLKFVDANDTACQLLGYSREQLLRLGPVDIVADASDSDIEQAVQFTISRAPKPCRVERDRWLRHANGHLIPVDVYRAARIIDGGAVVMAVARDVSDRRQADELLRLRTSAVEASDSAIVVVDVLKRHQPIQYVNRAFERITGYTSVEVVGRNSCMLLRDDLDQRDLEVLRAAMSSGEEARALLRNYRRDGRMFWSQIAVSPVRDAHGVVTHYVTTFSDVTELILYRKELEHRATHDPLTGLANRELLDDRVSVALASATRHRRLVALAFIDLDGFKGINDAFGHDAGDELLRSVARRLSGCVRDADTVARLGGDEFVLLLTDPESRDDVVQVLQRVRDAVAEPHPVGGVPMRLTCSIGVALFPDDSSAAGSSDSMLRLADQAMYRAKTKGRNRVCFTSPAPAGQ